MQSEAVRAGQAHLLWLLALLGVAVYAIFWPVIVFWHYPEVSAQSGFFFTLVKDRLVPLVIVFGYISFATGILFSNGSRLWRWSWLLVCWPLWALPLEWDIYWSYLVGWNGDWVRSVGAAICHEVSFSEEGSFVELTCKLKFMATVMVPFFGLAGLVTLVLKRVVQTQAGNERPHSASPASSIPGRITGTVSGRSGIVLLVAMALSGVTLARLSQDGSQMVASNSLFIIPPWFHLPVYSAIRAVPDKMAGVIIQFLFVLVPLTLPFLDRWHGAPRRKRTLYRLFALLLLVDLLLLIYLGLSPFEGWTIVLTRLAILYWFTHFLVVIPVVNRIEAKGEQGLPPRSTFS